MTDSIIKMQRIFQFQKTAVLEQVEVDAKTRQSQLERLLVFLRKDKDAIRRAIQQDFGNRSPHETLSAEIMTSCEDIKHALSHFKKWMRDSRASVPYWLLPASASVIKQPLGVVGIIVPWNYPLYLSMAPLTAALCAGNRVMMKMSEYTPAFSEYLSRSLGELFDESELHVVTGDASVAQEFSKLPFDHLFFTGSTAVGRAVMSAASHNLTPVTLELGGKSPAIVADDFPLETAVRRILFGKLTNAGQTCIAPDYVLLRDDRIPEFLSIARNVVESFYPKLDGNDDYTSIINTRQRVRLHGYVDEARHLGAQVVELHREVLPREHKKMTPVAIVPKKGDVLQVLEDEIFGPILPIIGCNDLPAAIRHVNARPRPLALYAFSNDSEVINQILRRTVSGGVTVNDVFWHVVSNDLPFGGIGPSGMGQYHGRAGFDTFTKSKGVFHQSRLNAGSLLMPPYTKLFERMVEFIIGR